MRRTQISMPKQMTCFISSIITKKEACLDIGCLCSIAIKNTFHLLYRISLFLRASKQQTNETARMERFVHVSRTFQGHQTCCSHKDHIFFLFSQPKEINVMRFICSYIFSAIKFILNFIIKNGIFVHAKWICSKMIYHILFQK